MAEIHEETATVVPVDEAGAMVVEGSGVQQYILQSPPNYKMELLQHIHELESDEILDFPIFLRDGVSGNLN